VTRNGGGGDRRAEPAEGGLRIRLFDADRTDKLLAFDEAMKAKTSARQLLWIDVEGELEDAARAAIVERFELAASTDRALAEDGGRPQLQLHGRHFQIAVAAEPDAEHPERAKWLEIVAGSNLVISRHPEPLEFLEAMNERIARDASIGELDSAEFVASLLDSIVTTYHAAVDGIEDELDAFDARALGRQASNELFSELVAIRRRVGRLRRLLAAHREVFGSLGRRDFGRGIESVDPDVFVPVTARFDAALVSVESTREVVLASFDVLMTRTAQRTNDVMRVLTLATVLALPATVTAGLLGMNVIVPVPADQPWSFWSILVVIVLLEMAVIVVARLKRWL
jgi:Mg2+ and Co2+ transporter CorA